MSVRMLFEGELWLVLVPILFGILLLSWGVFWSFFARRFNLPRQRRAQRLRMGRALIPALPMAGLFGTVYGLMDTLIFMKGKTGAALDMNGVVHRFGGALSTTLWGVFFAAIAIILYEMSLSQLEDADDVSEE